MKKNIIYIIIIIILVTAIISINLLPNKNSINNKKDVKRGLSVNGVINVNLMDDLNTPLKDITVSLYDEDGKYMDKEISDMDGLAAFKITQTGVYQISQTSNLEGYDKEKERYEVIISEKKPVAYKTITNKVNRGNIILYITNKKEEPLEKIKIELFNNKNEKVKDLITDDKGLTEIKDIPIGKYYYLIEGQDKKQEIVIKNKNDTATKTIKMSK